MATQARFLGSVGTSLAAMMILMACTQGAGTPAAAAADAPPPASGAPSQAEARGAVVIAVLVTHDSKVAIMGGGKDLRVVVRKMDGAIVADGITLAELRVLDPDLYEVVNSASASADGHTYVDALLMH